MLAYALAFAMLYVKLNTMYKYMPNLAHNKA